MALFELKRDKSNKMTCAPREGLSSAWACAQSGHFSQSDHQSLCSLPEEGLGPQLHVSIKPAVRTDQIGGSGLT